MQGVGILESTSISGLLQATRPATTAASPSGPLLHRIGRHPILRFLAQCALGIFVVGLFTVCGLGLHWNLSTASLMYLLFVVLSAHRFGFWQASIVSLAAVIIDGYCFAPPAFSFYIADPQNSVAIIVFEVIALLVSRISTRERSHASQMERQQRSLEQLFAVSRGALLLNPNGSPVQEMAELILRECAVDAVAILDAGSRELKTAGQWASSPSGLAEKVLSEDPAAEFGSPDALPGFSSRRILVSNEPIGSLLILSRSAILAPLTMDALASLVALTFDRYRAFHAERAAEAARQTEQLRTTVLDGLAHAFKTPLTIIRAASSGLLEMGHLDYMQQELTTLIDAESMKLNELTTRLLQTARVDTESVVLQRELVSVSALIRDVAASVTRVWAERRDQRGSPPFDRHRVQVHIDVLNGSEAESAASHEARVDSLTAMVDYDMISSTVRELLDNAAKYSTSGSPIFIRASRSHSEILVSVHNRGPVIPLEDRERIFERYYRCPGHRYSAPGTGIGLAMARNALQAHGGHIWVISGENRGTTFTFSLPRSLPTSLPPGSLTTSPLTPSSESQRTHRLETR